jgi:hypothetical protein
MHLLAAHAVAERDLALKDQDTHSVLGQPFRKRSASEPTTDRDHIVSFSHASFRNDDATLTGHQYTNCRIIMILPDGSLVEAKLSPF